MLVLYISDNENSRVWLAKRRAENRMARHCRRQLQRLEARHHFQVVSAGAYTRHNLSANLAMRATNEVPQTEMGRLGLHKVDLRPKWMELLRFYQTAALLIVLSGDYEGRQAAHQVASRRRRGSPSPHPLPPTHDGRLWWVFEWRAVRSLGAHA